MPDAPERRWRGSPRAWPVLQGMLPVERSRVPAEALAGLTLAAVGIPEVLGYAKIAGMPLVTGLYTMLLPMAAFAVLGSSRHLVVTADSATAAILAAALTGLAAASSEQYVRLAGLAALLTGAMLLAARLARLGFRPTSCPVPCWWDSYGVGIQVAAGQLPDMLGVTVTGRQTLPKLMNIVRALPHVHWADVAVSIAVIGVVVAARRINRRIPGALIAVIIAIIVSWAADLARHGVAVIGNIPRGLPSLGLPALGWHDTAALLGVALSMFVVILAQSAATSRAYAAKYEEPFDEDTDLVGLGAANAAAAFSGTFVVNGSPTGTGDRRHAGGPRPAVPADRLGRGPDCPGAAHRAAALPAGRRPGGGGLPDRRRARRRQGDAAHPGRQETRVRRGPAHGGAAVVVLGVEYGIVLAIIASIVDHLRHSYSPLNSVLVKSPEGHWQPVPCGPGARTEEGLVVYRFGTSLYYANASRLMDDVAALVSHGGPLRWLVIDCAAIGDVDYTASTILAKVIEHVHQHHVHPVLSSVLGPVQQQLNRYGISKALGQDAYFDTPGEALEAFHSTMR